MTWKRTISAKALSSAGHAAISVDGKVVFVVKDGDRYLGIDAVCSHARCILRDYEPQSRLVKCPCHHATFRIDTGEMVDPPYVAKDAPKEKLGLRTFQVREENGWVEVDV